MDISKITDQLYVSSTLQAGHIDELVVRDIHLAISMIGGQPPPHVFARPPFRLLWLQTCDSVLTPIPMAKLINGVQFALPLIEGGQSVLVYCAQGRHRSVAMAAAILIATGYTAREAMDLLRILRTIADPHAWHISRRILKFEKYWQNRDKRPVSMISHTGETYAEIATALASNIISCITALKGDRSAKSWPG